jgi:hypothetical protein
MPDERYAPPKVAVRDVPHEAVMQRRPRLVGAIVLLIAASWFADLPSAWAMYAQGEASRDAVMWVEAIAGLVLLLICIGLWRGQGWLRHLYTFLALLMAGLALFSGPGPALPLYASISADFSTALQLLPIGLLYFGPAANWYRDLCA